MAVALETRHQLPRASLTSKNTASVGLVPVGALAVLTTSSPLLIFEMLIRPVTDPSTRLVVPSVAVSLLLFSVSPDARNSSLERNRDITHRRQQSGRHPSHGQ